MGIGKVQIGFILGFYIVISFLQGQRLGFAIFGFVILVFGLIILRKINNIMKKELKSRK